MNHAFGASLLSCSPTSCGHEEQCIKKVGEGKEKASEEAFI